jgi:hypothetical protein
MLTTARTQLMAESTKLDLLKRHGVTMLLVLSALVLGAAVLWDRGRVSTREADDRQYQLFDAWRGDDLSRIDITLGDRKLQLASKPDEDGGRNWTLREGERQVDVDEQAIGQYLLSLEYASFERKVDGIADGTMGLDTPRATFVLEMGRLHYTLRLGGPAPSPSGSVYADVEGGGRSKQHYVVNRELVEALEIGHGALQARNLVPYLSGELFSISLTGPTGGGDAIAWKLSRGGWGGRTSAAFAIDAKSLEGVAASGKLRASRRALDGWLTQLASIDVDRFVELPKETAPGAHVLRLDPLAAGVPDAELELGGDCEGGQLVVRRKPRPAAGCAPAGAVSALLVNADRFVDRHVLGTAVNDVVELAMSSSEHELEVARKGQGWHMRKPQDATVAAGPLDQWLLSLIKAEGTIVGVGDDAAALADLGLDPPVVQLRIVGLPERGGTAGASERDERLAIGKTKDGWLHVMRNDDKALLRLPEDVGRAFYPRPSLLRSPTIYDVPLNNFRELTLDCGGKRQRLERALSGAWTMLEPTPDGLGADSGLANRLSEQLRKLTAVRWVSEKPEREHRLERPNCVVEARIVERADDDTKRERNLRVALGQGSQGGYYAQHDGSAAVFVAPRPFGLLARRWMLDRGGLQIRPDEVDKVSLSGAGGSLVVKRQGERWLVEGDPSSRVGDDVKRALEGLIAEAVVRLGPVAPSDGVGEPLLRIEIARKSGEPIVIRVGTGELFRDTSVFYVRRDGLEATFAVAQSRLRPLIDAL